MRLVLTKLQLLLLIIILGVFGLVILTTQKVAVFNTLSLFIFVAIIGLILCQQLRVSLNDPNLKVLGYFWLIKLILTFILLFAGWIPLLDPLLPNSGYDPIRYYYQAQELIENNWIFYGGLNYIGILYYYGTIFFIFGHNPIIPALINSFITLLATLYLINFAYEINPRRQPHDWTIAWALLLPEILWFDVMTSRETLIGALLIFTLLTIGRIINTVKQISIIKAAFILILSLIIIAAVRTSMLLPIVGSLTLFLILKKAKLYIRFYQILGFGLIFIAIVYTNQTIINFLGRETFDTGKAITTAMSSKENIATTANLEYSKNSISRIILPEGVFQSIIFLPPRMILYLLSPLPNIDVSLIKLIDAKSGAWQSLMTILSSLINIVAMPYVLAISIQSIRNRKENIAPLTLIIAYWVTFIAIAGGNLIIQERYRVMATLLLWSCAWLGARTCSKKILKRASLFWYGTLLSGALFYIFYKFI